VFVDANRPDAKKQEHTTKREAKQYVPHKNYNVYRVKSFHEFGETSGNCVR
jgi:hypothetical protein